MKCFLLLLLILISLSSASCCRPIDMDSRSAKPAKESLWQSQHANFIDTMGFFVMSKGESTDNGTLGVKVVDILPSKCRSAFSERGNYPKIILQFYHPHNHQVVCEVALDGGSNTAIDIPDRCGTKTDISVVGIAALSVKDSWVAFDLRK